MLVFAFRFLRLMLRQHRRTIVALMLSLVPRYRRGIFLFRLAHRSAFCSARWFIASRCVSGFCRARLSESDRGSRIEASRTRRHAVRCPCCWSCEWSRSRHRSPRARAQRRRSSPLCPAGFEKLRRSRAYRPRIEKRDERRLAIANAATDFDIG